MRVRTSGTGDDWLPPPPDGWTTLRAKYLFRQSRERAQGGHVQLAATQGYGVIPQADYMEHEDQKVVLALAGLDNFKRVRVDDFVISLRSFQGGIEHSAFDGAITPAYTVLRPSGDVQVSYYRYFLKSAGFVSALNSTTEGIRDGKAVPYESFGELVLPVPPASEQRRIAAFLDYETARIDELIRAQARLQQLVDEERAATISIALFDVPDSVPLLKLAMLADILTGPAFASADFVDAQDGVRLLRGINVSVKRLRWDETAYWPTAVDSSLSRYLLREGDVVFGMDRPWIAAGARQALVRTSDLPALLVQRVARLRARAGILPELLSFALESREFRAFVEADLTGVSVPHISGEQIGAFRVPVPPLDEQRSRVDQVNARHDSLDHALQESQRLVELLRERRSALITAAVTGQLDVSSWRPPDDWTAPEAA